MKKLLIGLLILINIWVVVPALAQSSMPATSIRTTDGRNLQVHLNELHLQNGDATAEILALQLNLDTHETFIQALKGNLDTHETYLQALNANIGTHETEITNIKLNLDTMDALLLAHSLNLGTHEIALEAIVLNISTLEGLLLSDYWTSATTKAYVDGTDEVQAAALLLKADKTQTDSTENALLAHKYATSNTHPASAITYTDTYGVGAANLQSFSDTIAVWLNSGTTGQVLMRTDTGWAASTIPSGVTDHLLLSNIGILTHDQIDSAIAALQANPGGITKMYGGIGDLIGVTGEVGIISGTGITVARSGNTIEVSATSSGSGATVESVINELYSARSQGSAASGYYRIFDFTAENAVVVPNTQMITDNGIIKYKDTDYVLSTWDNSGTTCIRATMQYDVDETSTIAISYFETLPLTAVISANTVSTTNGWLQDVLNNIYTKAETDLTVEVKIGEATAEINIGSYSNTTQMNSAIASAIASATAECQAKIWYPANMSDGEYTGEVIVDTMAASATVGQCLYLASDGWTIAKADAITTLPAYGLCVETGTGNRKVLTRGIVRNSGWSFTKGQRLYVSPSTGGAITSTRPSTGGQSIQAIGVALSVDTVYFKFDDTVAGL